MATIDPQRCRTMAYLGLTVALTIAQAAVAQIHTARLIADLTSLPGGQSSRPDELTMVGPRVYFAATTPESGRELHVSETTSNSTRQVIDLVPGRESSNPRDLFALSSGLLFVADDETTEPRLWYLAESSADPVEVLALSGASSCQYVARPDGGTFIACTDNPALFSPRGRLWIFNNDPSPPLLLTTASSQWSEESLKWGTGTAFVTRGDGAVVRSDGTLQGTSATNVVAPIFHGSAVFTDGSYAVLAGNPDLQLWRVDALTCSFGELMP